MPEVSLSPQGEVSVLQSLLTNVDWYAHLYTNDVDLEAPYSIASFVEPIWEGYAPQRCDRWTTAASRDGMALSVADPPQWSYAGGPPPLPLVGFFLTAGIRGEVITAGRFDTGPFQLSASDPVLTVLLKVFFRR